ncbi:MAG: thiamine phosphate synthase [bacterium]
MIDFRLYLITDRRLCRRRSGGTPDTETLEAALETACRAGVRAVQLREKDLDAKTIYETAARIRESTRARGTRLFINDRVDIALASGADGVHCPENGFPIPDAATLLGPSRTIGASVHSLDGARRAEDLGASFVTFGPVFATPSKAAYGPPQGLDAFGEVAGAVGIPVFAVGGVTPERAAACLDHGAAGVALISSILGADDIAAAVQNFEAVMGTL